MITKEDANKVEELLTFPAKYPLKVIANAHIAEPVMIQFIQEVLYKIELPHKIVNTKYSTGGKYYSITINLLLIKKGMLYYVYNDLNEHSDIIRIL